MNKHRSSNIKSLQETVIGNKEHQNFITLQASFGIAQRGGSFPITFQLQAKRLASNVNLLTYREKQELIFSETIFKN